MHIHYLPSTIGSPVGDPTQFATSVVINRSVAIDAGTLGFASKLDDQQAIDHIFLTHQHADHLASLPIFLLNVLEDRSEPIHLYANAETLECLREDILNGRYWLKLLESPKVKAVEVQSGDVIEANGLALEAVAVDHAVPTLGVLVREGPKTVVFSSDTGPTEALWQRAAQEEQVAAVFLELSFPESLRELGDQVGHLAPSSFRDQLLKARSLGLDCPFFSVHLKARHRETVVRELDALNLPNVQIARFGVPYNF